MREESALLHGAAHHQLSEQSHGDVGLDDGEERRHGEPATCAAAV